MCCFFHLEDCEFLNVVKAFVICKGRPLAEAARRAEQALRCQYRNMYSIPQENLLVKFLSSGPHCVRMI